MSDFYKRKATIHKAVANEDGSMSVEDADGKLVNVSKEVFDESYELVGTEKDLIALGWLDQVRPRIDIAESLKTITIELKTEAEVKALKAAEAEI